MGLALGPPGAMISGFVGSVVGDMAGSKIGEAVCKGGKAIVGIAAKVVKGCDRSDGRSRQKRGKDVESRRE